MKKTLLCALFLISPLRAIPHESVILSSLEFTSNAVVTLGRRAFGLVGRGYALNSDFSYPVPSLPVTLSAAVVSEV